MVWGVGVSVGVGRDNPATTSLATAPVLLATREASVTSVSQQLTYSTSCYMFMNTLGALE